MVSRGRRFCVSFQAYEVLGNLDDGGMGQSVARPGPRQAGDVGVLQRIIQEGADTHGNPWCRFTAGSEEARHPFGGGLRRVDTKLHRGSRGVMNRVGTKRSARPAHEIPGVSRFAGMDHVSPAKSRHCPRPVVCPTVCYPRAFA